MCVEHACHQPIKLQRGDMCIFENTREFSVQIVLEYPQLFSWQLGLR
jgi:hypothetical protein